VTRSTNLSFARAIVAVAAAGPLLAQYGGPAILARGQSPGAMAASQIDFRPYVSVTGTYDTGLNGVSVNPSGTLTNDASYGVTIGFGVSGLHSWKHTKIGLDYSSGYSHYTKSFYDGISSQSLLFSVTHQLSRHVMLALNNSAVLYGSNRAVPSLPPTVEFDPSTTNVPTNDFFDNRTITISSQASVSIQRSTRMSVNFGVDGFLTRRRSSALYGSNGLGGHADIQYRLNKRSTVGVMYGYTRYSFIGISGGTDSNTVAGTYSVILSRSTQFSALAGINQYENLFVQTVPIDPAIAAVIGISSAQQRFYQKNLTPDINARLSRTVPRGSIFLSGGHSINPGNGLFLTSTSTNVGAGYGYSGLRRWSITTGATYNLSNSQGNVVGTYGSESGNLSVSRQVAPMTHGVFSFNLRRYDSPDFKNYNKWSYGVNLGLSFTPGDIPLRFW